MHNLLREDQPFHIHGHSWTYKKPCTRTNLCIFWGSFGHLLLHDRKRGQHESGHVRGLPVRLDSDFSSSERTSGSVSPQEDSLSSTFLTVS
eukprot:1160701-Pelagomonas_calceolata.AAC.4